MILKSKFFEGGKISFTLATNELKMTREKVEKRNGID
jgi:hypothetical protein